MAKLIPLKSIPTTTARRAEAEARRGYASRRSMLSAARHKLVVAPGCHSGPSFDPPVIGWCLTAAAAAAYAAQLTRMPDGKSHRRAMHEALQY